MLMIGSENDTKWMHVMNRRQITHRVMIVCSILPEWLIRIGIKIDTCMGWVDHDEGLNWGFWMDASYWKWVRKDQRKQRSRCSRFARILRKSG
jgi:hypothetical protein